MNVLVSILFHKMSSSYPTLTISWPCQLVDTSCPYPQLSESSYIAGWYYHSTVLPTEVLERWDYPDRKCQLILQKGPTVLSILTCWLLSFTLQLVKSCPTHQQSYSNLLSIFKITLHVYLPISILLKKYYMLTSDTVHREYMIPHC
jgi:hypothetical protein